MPSPVIVTVIVALICIAVTAIITALATSAYQRKVAAATVGNSEEKAR